MNLPRVESAFVPRQKVEDYLLHLEHPVGEGIEKFKELLRKAVKAAGKE